jgi:predicted O-methyltransferase YrrM
MKPNKWQLFDESTDLLFPWYTYEFLNELRHWDISEWKIFEYGGGMSSLWWRKKAKECITIDTSAEWSSRNNLVFINKKEDFINYPMEVCKNTNELFDCIIIDSEPTEWRDSCTPTAISCLKKGGILIIDNWMQNSVSGCGEKSWPESQQILKDYKKTEKIYKQSNHKDWKTGVWIKQ